MKTLTVVNLGLQPYGPVWDLQKALHKAVKEGHHGDTLLLLEHLPVYTIGKNGKREHIIASPGYLKRENIQIYQVDRGGDVTYHGPGQLVGYPILDLHRHRLSVSWFMRSLEEVFLRVLKAFGVEGQRLSGYPGVWVGNKKILALGTRISQWVTMHGFAFNVKPNLSHFLGIIPCGIEDKGVTRLADLCDPCPTLREVLDKVILYFCEVFEYPKIDYGGKEIWNLLENLNRKSS